MGTGVVLGAGWWCWLEVPVVSPGWGTSPVFVQRVEPLTDDSAAITLAVPDDLASAFAFAAGQSLTVRRGEERVYTSEEVERTLGLDS